MPRWADHDIHLPHPPPGPASRAMLARLGDAVGRSNYAGLFGITLARGDGAYLWDVDGNCFLDALAGASAAILGYRVGEIADAQQRVADELQHSCLPYSPNEQVVLLAEKLQSLAPGDQETRVLFGSSGSDACGGALSAARKFTGKLGTFYFRDAYHGSTGLSQQASGFEALKQGLYRDSRDFVGLAFPDTPERAEQALVEIEEGLKTGAFGSLIAEPVQGDAGIRIAEPGFFHEVQQLLHRYGALLLMDEVQSGMGRTGTFFASEQEGVVPDVVTLAKGLSAGYAPISATLGRADVINSLAPAQEIFTYSGHGPSCAAALRCIEYILDESLCTHVERISARLLEGLRAVQAEFPDVITEVRGRGLMIGVEIDTHGAAWRAKAFATRGVEKGVYYGFFGNANQVVRIEPPLVIEEKQADTIVEITREVAQEFHDGTLPEHTLANVLRYGIGL